MIFSIKKNSMVYKNGSGARIAVRLSLPRCEESDGFNSLFSSIEEKYFDAARSFIASRNDGTTYFFDSQSEAFEDEKHIKIKNTATLRVNGRVIKSEETRNIFKKSLFNQKG